MAAILFNVGAARRALKSSVAKAGLRGTICISLGARRPCGERATRFPELRIFLRPSRRQQPVAAGPQPVQVPCGAPGRPPCRISATNPGIMISAFHSFEDATRRKIPRAKRGCAGETSVTTEPADRPTATELNPAWAACLPRIPLQGGDQASDSGISRRSQRQAHHEDLGSGKIESRARSRQTCPAGWNAPRRGVSAAADTLIQIASCGIIGEKSAPLFGRRLPFERVGPNGPPADDYATTTPARAACAGSPAPASSG